MAESHPWAKELHPAMQNWLLGGIGGICKQLLSPEDLLISLQVLPLLQADVQNPVLR